MVPEVWSDKFFSHPRPFFCCFTPLTAHKMKISKNGKSSWRYHNFTQLYQKSWSYVILFLRYCTWWIYFLFFILCYTFPFYPSNSPKNKNFKKKKKKMKKMPGDIIILHNCMKNHDHMLYCSWDMAQDRCNWCFSFWAIFCPFIP